MVNKRKKIESWLCSWFHFFHPFLSLFPPIKMEAVCSPLSLFREINCTFSILAPARMVSAAVPRVACSTCVALVKHNQRSTSSRDNSTTRTRAKTKTGHCISWALLQFQVSVQEWFLSYCVAGHLQTSTTGGRGGMQSLSLSLSNLFVG